VIGDWEKGWEIQVQPVAVQSKPKKDAGCRKEMWERRAFISVERSASPGPGDLMLSNSVPCGNPDSALEAPIRLLESLNGDSE
jgi:hypothetical protein